MNVSTAVAPRVDCEDRLGERVDGHPRDRGEWMVGRGDAQYGVGRQRDPAQPASCAAGYREADVGDAVEHECLDFV